MDVVQLREVLRSGLVIPAHPLALTPRRELDERHQRALTRYYLASGAGGIAVGVHTTQFAIHEPGVGLLAPVLEIAAEESQRFAESTDRKPVRVAGIIGPTKQAVSEAKLASNLGYNAGLLGLGALRDADDDRLIEHSAAIAEIIPLFGFYLQPAVGGRILDYQFWSRFVEIENVVAIKIAPFNRYWTLDVIRAVTESGRSDQIALYTGNDDNIIADLLTPYCLGQTKPQRALRIVGGLLGQWAVWTREAVRILDQIKKAEAGDLPHFLTLNVQLTDANAAIFDVAHNFAGCIAGLHYVLRRQGLLRGVWCFDPDENLSPGQAEEIERVRSAYPHLTDDDFVEENLENWLSG